MVQQRGRFCSFGRWRPSLPVGLPGWSIQPLTMFGGSSRQARRPFNLSGEGGTAGGGGRFALMTGNLPAAQGRAPHLYDEQLQRQQQEKMLMRLSGGDERPDLLAPAVKTAR